MKNLVYKELKIQSYLSQSNFTLKEIKLLFEIRSNSYKAKTNFKKMNRSNLNCSLQCKSKETQIHIFQSCKPVLDKMGLKKLPDFNFIYGTHIEQKYAIEVFVKIEDTRNQLLVLYCIQSLPGGTLPGPRLFQPQIQL